ncbi:hypothetical protein ACQ4PT_048542 [Festuca glaucescens]
MEDQYMEDIAQGARFDDTDDEEKDENNDSLVLADYEGDDLPTIESGNMEDPQLAEGTVFQTMMDCRNAITTYCILTKNDYEIKKNSIDHTCPPRAGEPEEKSKLAKTRWLADAIIDSLRETPSLGPTALISKISEKFDIKIPYMRMFYAKEMALDRINGPWNESFQLLYTFKAEVEMASPGSVVARQAYSSLQIEKREDNAEDLLLMKNTKTAAVPTVVIDAKNIEAIAYNIAATAQIQPSMSEPADVSLPLPSSDPLLMKNTKTAAVPTVVIDAKNIEAIAYNIAATAQIQPSMLTAAVPRV